MLLLLLSLLLLLLLLFTFGMFYDVSLSAKHGLTAELSYMPEYEATSS